MLDGFYTMGGRHFWEDVFFYQKWRIQRNNVSKTCRLLDPWDIGRKEGTFDECRKEFIKYIEAFEISRQKGHMIIMLPGLGDSKNIFKPLWRKALEKGFLAAAINYPSTQKDLDGHVRQIDFLLNHLEDVDKVSFVAKGMGCVVLKKLFALNSEWHQKLELGRIVQVAPLNHGSKLLHSLSKNSLLGFILGPSAKELHPREVEQISPFPQEIENGILLNRPLMTNILEKITGNSMPIFSESSEKDFEKAVDVQKVSCHKLNIFASSNVCEKVINFLQTGKF